MAGGGLMWLAAALAVAGILLLRASWARPVRSTPLNLCAWLALLAAAIVGGVEAGAWGMAVTALVATGAAMLLLAKAVFEQPRWKRPAKQPREVDGSGNDPKTGLSRRIVTFLLAGPIALAVSTLFALAARIALIATGASEADGNVAVLGLVPLVWPILAFALLMFERRTTQFLVTGAVAIATLLLVVLVGGQA
ncbi:hypothetical protein [Qipengyuania flava]|uniref:hypothetical protein n=1 Tax=Qipengyuania flava TaxID=192812 RepID=UPI00273ECBAB|nr:hypothetical protein [Qipengyuania flava]